MDTAMLRCVNISKTYRKGHWLSGGEENEVLRNISFEMEEGSTLGIVGENGSGKSTLTRIILGLEEPTKGDVFFEGENIQQMVRSGRNGFRENMQAVFQDPASFMNPRWDAFRVISEPVINFYKPDRSELTDRVAELMRSVALDPDDMFRNVTKFSGGQQQRICIARALALRPKLLILDEAVSNLDMLVQAQVLELLEKLKEERGLSLLLISHDVRVVFKMCGSVIVLDRGEIADRLSLSRGITGSESDAFQRLAECVR